MVVQESEIVQKNTQRRNALGFIFEGIDPELLERLNPKKADETDEPVSDDNSTENKSVDTLQNEQETRIPTSPTSEKGIENVDTILSHPAKIGRSFSLNYTIDNVSFVKYFQRRNGAADVFEHISNHEKGFLKDIYAHNVTASCELLGY